MPVADKNEFLFHKGVNFNELPNWQKRGIGVYWESYNKDAVNPITGEYVKASRNRLKTNLDLPMRDQYNNFMRNIVLEVIE